MCVCVCGKWNSYASHWRAGDAVKPLLRNVGVISDGGKHAQEEDWEQRCLGGELIARGWHNADAFSEITQICNHVWMVPR